MAYIKFLLYKLLKTNDKYYEQRIMFKMKAKYKKQLLNIKTKNAKSNKNLITNGDTQNQTPELLLRKTVAREVKRGGEL